MAIEGFESSSPAIDGLECSKPTTDGLERNDGLEIEVMDLLLYPSYEN